jgi:DNA-binding transcriptional MerR regulator
MIGSQRREGARRSKSPAPADPSKSGLKIGEAARLVGVKPFVLRFWETQFDFLRAGHSRYKHRTYEPSDIENLKLIKHLLHERRFTIEGAKKHLSQFGLEQVRAEMRGAPARAEPGSPETSSGLADATRQALSEIRRDLLDLQKLLQD